jgi:hypothetical protein
MRVSETYLPLEVPSTPEQRGKEVVTCDVFMNYYYYFYHYYYWATDIPEIMIKTKKKKLN